MDHTTFRRPATMADLIALPDNVKGEILDGVLYTQPRPRAWHASIGTCIAHDVHGLFHRGRGGPGGWWIIAEPGIHLPRAVEVSPDVAGWRRTRMPSFPGQRETFRMAPDWVCEVLSPSNRNYDLKVKRRFYAEIGVEHLWYVDPPARTLTVSRLHEGRWLELAVHGDDDRVRAEPFDAVEIDLTEWWPEVEADGSA